MASLLSFVKVLQFFVLPFLVVRFWQITEELVGYRDSNVIYCFLFFLVLYQRYYFTPDIILSSFKGRKLECFSKQTTNVRINGNTSFFFFLLPFVFQAKV